MAAQERLAETAGKVADQLAEKLLIPFQDTLARFEIALPGISARVAEAVNPDAIKAALSTATARTIQGLMSEGTEESLGKALAAVRELRSLVERGGSVDLEVVKELMPGKVVGPDAGIFKGKDIGEVPSLPADLLKILISKCSLANDGRSVAETHRLVLVPASVDGEPLTLNSLREFAIAAGKHRDPSFYPEDWYGKEAFADAPLQKSVWVLEYEDAVPGSFNEKDSQHIAKLSNYRTARVLEHVGTMVFQDLEHGERIYSNFYGRCEERAADASIIIGAFGADGLHITSGKSNHPEIFDWGHPVAIVRKLSA